MCILLASAVANAQYLVRSYDEAERESNTSKPRISIQNLGSSSLNGFQMRYRFLVEAGKTPVVENWYVPSGTASLVSVGGGLWDLVLAFPTQVLQPGQIFPNTSGLVVGLHYADWSAWDKSDDPSHQVATSLQPNGKVVVEDASGNFLAGSFPPAGVAGRPRIVVAAREEAMNEGNVSRIRLLARNVGDGATDSLRLQYHFASEGNKIPQLDVYDAAGAVVSLHRIAGRNWRVQIDYSGRRIGPGKRTSEMGALFALHYSDWSAWNKKNDHSNPSSGSFVVSRDVVGETENDNVSGVVPTAEEFAINSDVVGVPAKGTMVAAADGASYLLKPDGSVWGWGYVNQYSRFGTASRHGARFGGVIQEYPVQISELKDIRTITASGDHLLALDGNGVVWAVGTTMKAQVLAAHADADKMAAGTCDRACAIGGLASIKSVSTGGWSRNIALDKDGYVYQWGMPTNRNEDWVGPPQQIAATSGAGFLTGMVEIRSCDGVSLARDANGGAYALESRLRSADSGRRFGNRPVGLRRRILRWHVAEDGRIASSFGGAIRGDTLHGFGCDWSSRFREHRQPGQRMDRQVQGRWKRVGVEHQRLDRTAHDADGAERIRWRDVDRRLEFACDRRPGRWHRVGHGAGDERRPGQRSAYEFDSSCQSGRRRLERRVEHDRRIG